MIPEKSAERASDLIMMNQGLGALSGHRPFLGGFTLHSNSKNRLNKTQEKNTRDALSTTEALGTALTTYSCRMLWKWNKRDY